MDCRLKKNNVEIIILEAEDGFTLTNGETYSKQVYLGIYDSPDNWWEIPDSEVPEENLENQILI